MATSGIRAFGPGGGLYYYGRWTSLRPWGWTWIGSDPWAWPTHHYGRWGFSGSSWFWIPGRTWGPAWVSWAYAPGYVSWCPLGWNNRAVYGFSYGGGYRGYDPWNAWTVVPHHGFGRGYVNLNVVNSTRIDVRTRNAFVVRDASPDVVGHAVPRSSAPIRSAGRARRAAEHGWRLIPRIARRPVEPRPPPLATPSAAFRSRRSVSGNVKRHRLPGARARAAVDVVAPSANAAIAVPVAGRRCANS